MEYIIVGLGNPGTEYEHTRHNVGRMVVAKLHEKLSGSEWRYDKGLRAQVAVAQCDSAKVRLVLPDNYMNRSGGSVAPLVKSKKALERLLVAHDDIDLPFGTLRFVHNRGAGGHNGVLSVQRSLRTQEFTRLRIGVIPLTPSGKPKKPKGADAVHDFVLSGFTKREREALDVLLERAADALISCVRHGVTRAQCEWNN